jgi:hypothetical protein
VKQKWTDVGLVVIVFITLVLVGWAAVWALRAL